MNVHKSIAVTATNHRTQSSFTIAVKACQTLLLWAQGWGSVVSVHHYFGRFTALQVRMKPDLPSRPKHSLIPHPCLLEDSFLVLILQTFQYELTHPPAAWRNTGQTAGTVVVCFEPWFTFLLTGKKHRLQMVFVSQTEPTRHLLVYAAQMRVGKPLCFCCF